MALAGIRVVEMAGLAPAPFCGMILADFGAQVTRIEKPSGGPDVDSLTRGKRTLAINLKTPEGVAIVKRLCRQSDVLIEPFRPGVMEKLGLGPQTLHQQNPRLIYARLTGYGQTGPYKHLAGHDINYLAISGVLSMLGRADERPYAPINLLADFAGGGLVCAFRILLAILEREKTNKGQIIDSSMVEGAAYTASWLFHSRHLDFLWGKERGRNLLDGGSPIYDTYRTADGKFVAVGAIEPQFHGELFDKLGLNVDTSQLFEEPETVRRSLAEKFRTKTRDEWSAHFRNSDACVSPVLEFKEVGDNEHNKERQSFSHHPDSPDCPWTPAPGPAPRPTVECPRNPREILIELGYSSDEIRKFAEHRVVKVDEQSKL